MSANQSWVETYGEQAADLYRSRENYTLAQIAERLGVTRQTVSTAVRKLIPPDEYRALKSLKYSASKLGDKNPMKGKTGEDHHNWKGVCDDGYGYLTTLWLGRRVFIHHVVMMEALGVTALPTGMVVHHIDGDPKNNALDNLALMTRAGHVRVHFLQVKDSASVSARKFKLAEALKSMT